MKIAVSTNGKSLDSQEDRFKKPYMHWNRTNCSNSVNPMFVPVPEKWGGGESAAVAAVAAEVLHKECLPVFFYWFAR